MSKIVYCKFCREILKENESHMLIHTEEWAVIYIEKSAYDELFKVLEFYADMVRNSSNDSKWPDMPVLEPDKSNGWQPLGTRAMDVVDKYRGEIE